MSVLFAYIDDAGNYEQYRSSEFIRRNPYYLRGCVIVPAANARSFTDRRQAICKKFEVAEYCELKWQHLWKLRRRDERGHNVSLSQAEKFLTHVTFNGSVEGFGVIEVPTREDCRQHLRERLAGCVSANQTGERHTVLRAPKRTLCFHLDYADEDQQT
jgi:hypothetical protein